jgi:hypothetical protein
MMKSTALLVCCMLAVAGLGLSRQADSDRSHDLWLQERYFEAISIKEGMTRADLLRVFRTDGGLQSYLPTHYVLKGSNFIKVDVEFDVPQDAKGSIVPEDMRGEMEGPAFDLNGNQMPEREYQYVPNEQLRIKSISRPYIEQVTCD